MKCSKYFFTSILLYCCSFQPIYAQGMAQPNQTNTNETSNWTSYTVTGNPFPKGQCTYYAWSRFYQIYGYDSGARGNARFNADEVVRAHPDAFELSSQPKSKSIFSASSGTWFPQYGHVGFIEKVQGNTIWISEGNVYINGVGGNIRTYQTTLSQLQAQYPDIVFANPK